MHLLGKEGLAPMLFRILFFVAVGELFIPEISAKFFIETVDKSKRTTKIRLHECASTPKASSPLNSLGTLEASEVSTINGMKCKKVSNGSKRQYIYETANFYFASNLAPKRTANDSWLSQDPAKTTSVGVTLFDKADDNYDFPEITDGSEDESTLKRLREQSKTALVSANVLDDKNVEDFALYLGKDNFNGFIHPTQKLVEQLKLFGDVAKRTRDRYNSVIFDFTMDRETKKKIIEQLETAIGFLSRKVVDPCVVYEQYAAGARDADAQCEKICLFLATGFAAFQVPSYTAYYGSIVSGACLHDQRCRCKRESIIYRIGPVQFNVRMVELSNEVRVGIAKKTPRAAGHV